MLEIAILGPPLLRYDGEPFALPTKKCLAIVSYIAVEGPTHRGKLADLFWENLGPEQARSNLRRELNRLRHTPLKDQLEAGTDTVALSEPFSLDVRSFAAHVDARSFSAALALYRGRLLDGLDLRDAEAFEGWLGQKRMALSDAHGLVLRRQAEVLESGGDLRGALGLHLEALRTEPLQEVHEREAIRLHYLLGERDAALSRYKRFEAALEKELLLEPMPETRELVRRIRALETVASKSEPPAPSRRVALGLVGRARELELIARRTPALALIVGDAGIGKTRLAEEFARAHSPKVWLRGSEASMSTPFGPVAMALHEAMEEPARAAKLLGLPRVFRCEAARLVPDLDPEALPLSLAPEARPRFLEGLARALFAAVDPAGTLILDDVHWFDASSAELALHLARRAEKFGVHVILTARASELADNPSVLGPIQSLEREGLLDRFELAPMTESEVYELAGRVLAAGAWSELFARLYAGTGGNPLYVLETLKALSSDAGVLEGGELPLALGVREALAKQVERLGGEVARVLEAASLADDGFTLAELKGVSALGETEEREAFDRAVGAHLLLQRGRHWSFHHDLVRRALAESIGPARRELIHSRIADNLTALSGAPSRIARHLELAGRRAEALSHHEAAARAALTVYAHAEALAEYQAALGCDPDEARAFEIRSARVEIFGALDDRRAWTAELDALTELARHLADPSFQARAEIARAKLENAVGRYAEAVLLMERTVAQHASTPGIGAAAMYAGGRARQALGRVAEAETWYRRALEAAPSPELTPELYLALYACAIDKNRLDEAKGFNAEAMRAFAAAKDRVGLARAQANDAVIARRERDYTKAIASYEHAYREAELMGLLSLQRTTVMGLVGALYDAGEIDKSIEWVELGLGLAKEPQDPLMEARTHHQLCALTWAKGDLARSIEGSERAIEIADRIGAGAWRVLFRCGFVHSLAEIGDAELALERSNEALRLAQELELPRHVALAEMHLGHAEIANGAYDAAAERLERVLSAREQLSAIDQEHALTLLAQAWLLKGEARRALEVATEREVHIVHRSRQLSVMLEAKLALGLDVASDLESALGVLGEPKLPPVESLALRRTLCRAYEKLGNMEASVRERDEARKVARRLADSLEARPELARKFAARNRDFVA